jgi:hypothetical protein
MASVNKAARAAKYRTFTLAQIEEADATECGLCLACGALRDCCEPDARRYRCEECNENQVYGANEIMMMGLCTD